MVGAATLFVFGSVGGVGGRKGESFVYLGSINQCGGIGFVGGVW